MLWCCPIFALTLVFTHFLGFVLPNRAMPMGAWRVLSANSCCAGRSASNHWMAALRRDNARRSQRSSARALTTLAAVLFMLRSTPNSLTPASNISAEFQPQAFLPTGDSIYPWTHSPLHTLVTIAALA